MQVPILFPATADSVVAAVQKAITEHEQTNSSKIKLAVFSHITSVPSIILPVERLTTLCHQHSVQVLIDGAHALGSIPLDLRAMNVDYYAANAHKWLFTPKGTAFLWVSPTLQPTIVPTVISSENKFNATSFAVQYLYTGTRDYTGFCSITAALDFRRMVGEDRLVQYVHNLAVQAGHYLAKTWGTEVLAEDSMVGPMTNVRLPSTDTALLNNLTNILFENHNMYIVVYPLNNQYWTRLSAQIYLEMSDFVNLGEVVKNILAPK